MLDLGSTESGYRYQQCCRIMLHDHAKRYRSWNMSAQTWLDRAERLTPFAALPKRELAAIVALVWGK